MYGKEQTTKSDSLNVPAYPLSEAARYLRLSPATLRSWFVGRPYPTARGTSHFRPLLKPARTDPTTLSFFNLIEAHILRSLRTEHVVPLAAVRQALAYAERELGIDHLLLREELRTSGGALFLERYGELVNLAASGQLAVRKLFEAHLARVEWGKLRSAVRLYPLSTSPTATSDFNSRRFSKMPACQSNATAITSLPAPPTKSGWRSSAQETGSR